MSVDSVQNELKRVTTDVFLYSSSNFQDPSLFSTIDLPTIVLGGLLALPSFTVAVSLHLYVGLKRLKLGFKALRA